MAEDHVHHDWRGPGGRLCAFPGPCKDRQQQPQQHHAEGEAAADGDDANATLPLGPVVINSATAVAPGAANANNPRKITAQQRERERVDGARAQEQKEADARRKNAGGIKALIAQRKAKKQAADLDVEARRRAALVAQAGGTADAEASAGKGIAPHVARNTPSPPHPAAATATGADDAISVLGGGWQRVVGSKDWVRAASITGGASSQARGRAGVGYTAPLPLQHDVQQQRGVIRIQKSQSRERKTYMRLNGTHLSLFPPSWPLLLCDILPPLTRADDRAGQS